MNVSPAHYASYMVGAKTLLFLTEFYSIKKKNPNNLSTFYNDIITESYIFIALLMLPTIFISL